MFTTFNETTHKHEWTINKWYEKFTFVIGVLYLGFLSAAFTIGFLVGFINALS